MIVSKMLKKISWVFFIKASAFGIFLGILSIAFAIFMRDDKSFSMYFYEYGKVVIKYSSLSLGISVTGFVAWKIVAEIRHSYLNWIATFNTPKREYSILNLKVRSAIGLSWGLFTFLITFMLYSSGDGSEITTQWLINLPLISFSIGFLLPPEGLAGSVKFPVGLAYLWGIISYWVIFQWMKTDYNFDMDRSGSLTPKDLASVIYYFLVAPAYLISEIRPELNEELSRIFNLKRSNGETITEILILLMYISYIFTMRKKTSELKNSLDDMMVKMIGLKKR